jgi:2-polyprenyl-3-methyl-5-hydroxy-6-metoxy-1,4-benzoquinol methylase
MNEKQLKQCLTALNTIENMVGVLRNALSKPTKEKKQKEKKKPEPNRAVSAPTAQLGPIPGWHGKQWPEAIPPHLIVSEQAPDSEKSFRALQIVAMVAELVDGARCFDFGCGHGHVAIEMGERAKSIIGYDITKHESWDRLESKKVRFTTDRQEIEKGAPYGFIMAYDVFDHLVGEDQVDAMKWLHKLLADDGKIFVRFHPWTSRHGSHSYETTNKAYIHLALTPDELAKEDIQTESVTRLNKPLATYESWANQAQLSVAKRKVHTEEVESFFAGPLLERIVNVTWGGNVDKSTALKIMTNQFIDMTLKKGAQ